MLSTPKSIAHEEVLGFPIAAAPFAEQIDIIMCWASQRLNRMVCVANVHMIMEANWNSDFGNILSEADLLTPDGMPLVWALNLLRRRKHDRVAGMYIMQEICRRAEISGLQVYFLGTDNHTLSRMHSRLSAEYPLLEIAGMKPLPFRPLTTEETEQIAKTINESNAGVVFVALGCPKQEVWMHQNRSKIMATMIGVGGVFPIYAGLQKHAPTWIQEAGLEWLYRLIQEPKRLWRRYLRTIPPFIFLSTRQILKVRCQDVFTRFRSENQAKG